MLDTRFGNQLKEQSLIAQNVSSDGAFPKVEYFLDVGGLSEFAKAYPNQLSGSMKQSVAIARALASEGTL